MVTVEVEVRGLVDDARLRLDGQLLPEGTTHLTLSMGTHLLACFAPGHRSSGRILEVAEDTREVTFSLVRDEESELVRAGPPASGLATGAREAARSLAIELILVDLWETDGVSRVRATDLGSGRVAELELEPESEASEVALLLTRVLLPPIVADDRGGSAVPWILAGSALAVAATVVTIIAVTSSGSADGFSVNWERE